MAAGWLAAAVATTAVGVAAIDTLGAGLLSGPSADAPLSEADVQRRLASESPGTAAASSTTPSQTVPSQTVPSQTVPSQTATTTSPPAVRGLPTPGGIVHASCDGGLARLSSWSPAQGYRADDPVRGPASSVSIKFKRDREEMTIIVTCRAGEPIAQVIPDDD